ncbi:hypothetical protein NCC49_004116 [Naganishia albida]|nr:hypothetical protein NCC49_004116 [Naganishia albida]
MAPQNPAVEAKILEAVAFARRQEGPDLKSIAREFEVPYQKFWPRYNGSVNSQFTRPGANKRLTDAQKGALKKYLQTLQNMGASLQLAGIECAANHFLKLSWESERANASEEVEDGAEVSAGAIRQETSRSHHRRSETSSVGQSLCARPPENDGVLQQPS